MDKKAARIRRGLRARMKIRELGAVRLVVHRTPKHIYAQIIAPNGSQTLVAASTLEKGVIEGLGFTGNIEAAASLLHRAGCKIRGVQNTVQVVFACSFHGNKLTDGH